MTICERSDCCRQASFNTEGEKKGRFCKEHIEPGMVNVKAIQCEKCNMQPSFNFKGQRRRRFCKEHAEPGMIDIVSKRCKKCSRRPNFNFQGESEALCCAEHIEPGMVNVISKPCEKCDRQPTFNFADQKNGRFCKEHAPFGMIDVKSKRCEDIGCNQQPSFNFSDQMQGRFCKKHAAPEMVDVRSKRCQDPGCNRQPAFNFEGQPTGRYCKKHAEPNMVNIKNKRCEVCNRQPTFNFEGQKHGRFCKEHSDPGMVDVKNRRCEKCKRRPTFNFEGQLPGCRCAEHIEPGMVDVVNKRCAICVIPKQPNFGKPGHSAIHCAQHRQAGEIFYPKRRCEVKGCKDVALFGMDSIPKFCEQHKSPEHLNLVYQICTVCGVLEFVDDVGKCSRCSEYLRKRLYCRKQRLVKSWIDAEPQTAGLFRYEAYDRQIDAGACGKERPDFMWEAGTHKVILEVDEDQHKDRPCECEQVRMVNVTSSIGMPCFWIRFNPDEFKGCRTIKDAHRRDLLIRALKTAIQTPPTSESEFCRVQHLFFDGFKLGESLQTETIPML